MSSTIDCIWRIWYCELKKSHPKKLTYIICFPQLRSYHVCWTITVWLIAKSFFFVHISKACSYFPREIDKILGYHRRNKGKNYVNFGDQMACGWWYDWENHGICYHQTLWKRKRNNCVNINPHTWELHILNFSLKFSFKICYSQVQSVKLVFIS